MNNNQLIKHIFILKIHYMYWFSVTPGDLVRSSYDITVQLWKTKKTLKMSIWHVFLKGMDYLPVKSSCIAMGLTERTCQCFPAFLKNWETREKVEVKTPEFLFFMACSKIISIGLALKIWLTSIWKPLIIFFFLKTSCKSFARSNSPLKLQVIFYSQQLTIW